MRQTEGPKIVMVGGGSYNWCPRLIADLMQTPELEGSEIVLLDPNRAAAEEVRDSARTMAAALGKKFRVRATSSEASAFRDADFVIITISTGGLDMMAHDLSIPEKYGIFATVGDTAGPGGWCRALRNVPVFVHLGQAIERSSPRAVVLNYTNPMASLTATLHQATRLRVVGLCHGVFSNYHVLQQLFGVEEKELSVSCAGVNHFFWFLDFTVKGAPGYPLLRRRLARQSLDQALRTETTDLAGFHSSHALCEALWREHGYLPYVGDRHTCEFLSGTIAPAVSVLERYRLVRTSVGERRAALRTARRFTLRLASGKETPPARSREAAVDIILAVWRHRPFFDVMNLPNTGQVENLPRGAVVETLGLADGLGFRALTAGPLPAAVERLVAPHCRVQQMTVEAAMEGNREQALEALAMDPQCTHLSSRQVRKMGGELMAATRAYLPQFKTRRRL